MPMLLGTLLDSIPVTYLPFDMVSAMWTIGSISDGNLFLTKQLQNYSYNILRVSLKSFC